MAGWQRIAFSNAVARKFNLVLPALVVVAVAAVVIAVNIEIYIPGHWEY